tara:strand:- start:519 stop:767 length:249 start_codon:yes stop_codon:yes gene_type:complete
VFAITRVNSTYPETCGKTIEEIEVLFSDKAPHPWTTKKGHSRLEEETGAVITAQAKDLAREIVEKGIQQDRGVHAENETESV